VLFNHIKIGMPYLIVLVYKDSTLLMRKIVILLIIIMIKLSLRESLI